MTSQSFKLGLIIGGWVPSEPVPAWVYFAVIGLIAVALGGPGIISRWKLHRVKQRLMKERETTK